MVRIRDRAACRPTDRTIGRFFADEVAAPLDLEFYIGLPDTVTDDRIAVMQGDWYRTKMLANLNKLPGKFVKGFLNPRSITARTFANPKVVGMPVRYNDRELRRIELPASNGIGQVRSIAKAYGEFATGGQALGIDEVTMHALTYAPAPPIDRQFSKADAPIMRPSGAEVIEMESRQARKAQ